MADVYTIAECDYGIKCYQKGSVEFTENGSVIIPVSLFTRGSLQAEDGTWGTLAVAFSNHSTGDEWATVTTFTGAESNFMVEFYEAAYQRVKLTSVGYRGTVTTYFNGRAY